MASFNLPTYEPTRSPIPRDSYNLLFPMGSPDARDGVLLLSCKTSLPLSFPNFSLLRTVRFQRSFSVPETCFLIEVRMASFNLPTYEPTRSPNTISHSSGLLTPASSRHLFQNDGLA